MTQFLEKQAHILTEQFVLCSVHVLFHAVHFAQELQSKIAKNQEYMVQISHLFPNPVCFYSFEGNFYPTYALYLVNM